MLRAGPLGSHLCIVAAVHLPAPALTRTHVHTHTHTCNTQVQQSFERSLQNLQTPYVDSLVLHSPLPTMPQARGSVACCLL